MQHHEVTLEHLIERYPVLDSCRKDIGSAFQCLQTCYEGGGKALICGNGGSAADAEHLVAELMKSFARRRPIPSALRRQIEARLGSDGTPLAQKLQGALPAIALSAHSALVSAISNDMDPALIFAQQVVGYGKTGDVLIAISTSGRSQNVLQAAQVARALGLVTIGFTGEQGGELKQLCDLVVCVPGREPREIQELQLPVYHALCQMLEDHFFAEELRLQPEDP